MEIPELLKNGGSDVDVFCIANSWAIQNSFYDKWIEGPKDERAFLDVLFRYLETNGHEYKWIIPGDDIIIRLLNERLLTEAEFYKIMPLSKIENRSLLGSKAGFSALCNKYDIITPKFLIYHPNYTYKDIQTLLGTPFLLKVDRSEGGFGVFLCENESQFGEIIGAMDDTENLVFQQYINGYDINTEALYKNGKLITYSYSRTIKIMGKFGVSTQRLFYQNGEIEIELQNIGERLGISGFANIVFMFCETNRQHYLIEVDLRPNAWMNYGRFLGNDFSQGIRNIVSGSLELVKPSAYFEGKMMKICLFKKDLYRCIVEKDFKGLCAWLFNKEGRWRFVPWHDRKLLVACTSYLIRNFLDFAYNKVRKVIKINR